MFNYICERGVEAKEKMLFYRTLSCLDPPLLQCSCALAVFPTTVQQWGSSQWKVQDHVPSSPVHWRGFVFFRQAFIIFVAWSVGQWQWWLLSGLSVAFLLCDSPLLLERVFCVASTLVHISLVAVYVRIHIKGFVVPRLTDHREIRSKTWKAKSPWKIAYPKYQQKL